MYRNTPQSSTHVTPASLIYKLPTTKVSLRSHRSRPFRTSFRHGDAVLVPNTHNGSALKWQEGLVQQRLGPVSYVVTVR